MKIGLEKTSIRKVEEVSFGLEEVLEFIEAGNELEACLSTDAEDALLNLKQVHEALVESRNPTALKSLLKYDTMFLDVFGSNELLWEEKLSTFIDKEESVMVSKEGMKLQDFLRWTIGGVIIGKYLASVGRVIKKLKHNIDLLKGPTEEVEWVNKTSQYLPSYNETMAILKTVEKLQNLIIGVSKNTASMDDKKVLALLKELGIESGKNPNTRTNWKIVAGSLVGAVMGGVIFLSIPTSGLLFPILGNIFGKGIFDKKGRVIAKRGWDSKAKILEATQKALTVFEKTLEFEKLSSNFTKSVTITEKNEAAVRTTGYLLKAMLKSYKRLMAVLGRGLASL